MAPEAAKATRTAKIPKARGPVDESRRFARSLVTPEGVDLGVRIATAGERAGAFIIDALIILMTLILFILLVTYVQGGGATGDFVTIVFLIVFFGIRNFYFMLFELGARSATPGKRLFRIRVASRGGGLLRADAIFARNAMREVEVFLPLSFMVSGSSSVDGLIVLMGFLWTAVFIFFPLFNRDRLRAGDVIAGTWVVQTPRKQLLSDLATRTEAQAPMAAMFTAEQLDAYGIKELHVLDHSGGRPYPQEDPLDKSANGKRWRLPARLLRRPARPPRIPPADGRPPRRQAREGPLVEDLRQFVRRGAFLDGAQLMIERGDAG
jgi:uncharacterized RDD family membrane protein YckC